MPARLSVELAVARAIELADEAGLGAVTMAAVAERCGFKTMSLYRHVANKDELILRMLDTTLGTAPALRSSGWRAGLEQWARDVFEILVRHPWAIDVPITGTVGTHAQLSWLDRSLEAMGGTNLNERQKAEISLLLNGYVFWAARLRRQLPQEPTEVIPPPMDMSAYPALMRAVAAGIFEDGSTPEDQFTFGLERVLDGIGALIG